jgi:hypothetical protein
MDEEQRDERAVLIEITVIKYGDKQSVVQWVDDSGFAQRVTLKNTYLREDMRVKDEHLKKAIPYGLDFKDIVVSLPDARNIENAFHAHGIWTAEDVRNHPDWVLAALSSIYSPILKALMQYIKAKKI